jgi:hypothetical protein
VKRRRLRRGRKLVILAAVVLVAVAGAAVWVLALRDDDAGPRDTADLPPARADEARATLAYLDGDGAALLRVHKAAAGDPLGEGSGRCRQIVRELDSEVRPYRAAGLTGGVPDEPMRAVLSEQLLALGTALTRCADDEVTAPDEDRLTRATNLTSQRLEELREAAR